MATRLAKPIEFAVNSKEIECIEFEEAPNRTLSTRDSHALLELIESDPEPTEASKAAFARYRNRVAKRPSTKV